MLSALLSPAESRGREVSHDRRKHDGNNPILLNSGFAFGLREREIKRNTDRGEGREGERVQLCSRADGASTAMSHRGAAEPRRRGRGGGLEERARAGLS